MRLAILHGCIGRSRRRAVSMTGPVGVNLGLFLDGLSIPFYCLSSLLKQIEDGFAFAIVGHVEGALLDLVGEARRDAERVVDRGMQVLDDDRVLDRLAGPLVRRLAV